jgi:hypothetical protein
MTTFADIVSEIVARLERNAADARGDSFEAGRKDAYSYAAQIVKEIAASHDLRAAAIATLDSTQSGEEMAASLGGIPAAAAIDADTLLSYLSGEEPQKEDRGHD